MLESDKARGHLDHLWWTTPTFLLTGVILTAKFIYYEVSWILSLYHSYRSHIVKTVIYGLN